MSEDVGVGGEGEMKVSAQSSGFSSGLGHAKSEDHGGPKVLPVKAMESESVRDGFEVVREKLPLVRVKRKLGVEPVDSLWLEVSTRPSKRRELEASLLRLQGLQLGGASSSAQNVAMEGRGGSEGPTRKLFRRLETVTPASLSNADTSKQLFRLMESNKESRGGPRADRRPDVHKERQEKLLSKAREDHMAAARSARFEQVQRSRQATAGDRGGGASEEDAMAGMFQLYDVVRVDRDEEAEARRAERREKAKRERDAAAAEGKLLCNYMPLLLEYVPQAAADVEQRLDSSKAPLSSDGKKSGAEEEEIGEEGGQASGQFNPPLPDVRDVLGPPRGPRLGALPLRVELGGGGLTGGAAGKPKQPLLLLEYKPLSVEGSVVPRPLGAAGGGGGDASEEECVYDLYCMEEDAMPHDDEAHASAIPHPVVRVVEDQYEEADDEISEYDSEDSNAENNPNNDYPDEDEEEDEGWYDREGMLEDDRSNGGVKVYNDSEEEYDEMIDDDDDYDRDRRSI